MVASRKTRKSRNTRKQRGAGVLTSQQFFNPEILSPTGGLSNALSGLSTSTELRPVMPATFEAADPTQPMQVGAGRRTTRRARGGFSPSIMGGFVANAQAAIVPLALYLVYHTVVPKKGEKSVGGRATRKASRRNARK